ncbi:MAG TPA: energy transducer TonB [Thermoanaerobaculia bacterium]|nr:energy transducer TonB [Thermoanaerobaculia bacterium]
MIAIAAAVLACSVATISADTAISNPESWSANGRYCAIVRWHEDIPDFESRRAEDVEPEKLKTVVTVALYERGTSRPEPIREIAIDANDARQLLVSDSGRYIVGIGGTSGGCTGRLSEDDDLVVIYQTDGTLIGRRKAREVFEPYDIWQLGRLNFALVGADEKSELVAIRVGDSDRVVESRIDLATAALLDPRRPIYPRPRVFATAAASSAERAYEPAAATCAAYFNDGDVVPLPSARVFANAVSTPLPDFPVVAMRARIRGVVRVEVIVSEHGTVLCARASKFPFGVSDVAAAAAKQWRFNPILIDGIPVKYSGDVLFHFEDADVDQPRM